MKKILPFLKIILWILGSFIVIHIFGIIGILFVAAFPLWWLISPKKTVCFFCRWKKQGEICPACGIKVNHKEDYPKNFRSITLNSFAIIFIFLSCLAFLVLEFKTLSVLGFIPVSKSVSFYIPVKSQYRLGEIFNMNIDLTDVDTPINTVQADISFDKTTLELIDITTKDSFADIFVQKEIMNDSGLARISGGVPNPGITCTTCHFASIYFKGIKPGIAKVSYLPTSMVLANNGKGINIANDFGTASFIILPEVVGNDELEKQNLALKDLLGASTNKVQLNLYAGNSILEKKVLGSEVQYQDNQSRNISKEILSRLQDIDTRILNFYGFKI